VLGFAFQVSFADLTTEGYIDLSKRRVSPEDITKCEERYTKSKTVASIMRHVASRSGGVVVASDDADKKEDGEGEAAIVGETEEERLESLYEQIAWPVGKKYGHPYDAFKLALTYVKSFVITRLVLILHAVSLTKFLEVCPQSHRQRLRSCRQPLRGGLHRNRSNFVRTSSLHVTNPQASTPSKRRFGPARK
jgi:hypothetical protein